MAGQARRIPASEKAPQDFLPPALPEVKKKVFVLTINRAEGAAESMTLILRPGDVATIDGKTILEG